MNDFWIGVISGLVTSCICWIIKEVFDFFRYYKGSKYSGMWVNEILDESNQVIKRDIATIKHNKKTNCITGRVKREIPYGIPQKKWRCSGVITDSHIIASFWPEQLIKSDGCVYATFVNDYVYEGYYLKEIDNGIKKVKIRLTKQTH